MGYNKRGRPKGIKKDNRLNIMISSNLKDEYQKILDLECSNISVKTCELISEYISRHSNIKES